MDKITIRHALLNDVPVVRQIAIKTWPSAYGKILAQDQIVYMLGILYSEEVLTNHILSGEQAFLLLSIENTPIAFTAYGPKKEETSTYKLHKLYILPAYQGKGYGEMLILKVIAIAKSFGKRILELNVNRNNRALKFYEKMGFTIIRTVDIPIGPYWMNDYMMQIDIGDK